MGRAEGSLVKVGLSRYDAVGGLKNELDGAEIVAVPLGTNVRSVREIGRLIAHREGIDANAELLVEAHIKVHALEQVGRTVVEIVEHVVAQIIEPKLMRIADGLLVGLFETQV